MRARVSASIVATAIAAIAGCGPDESAQGQLRVGAVLGERPVLSEVIIEPGAFLAACETATVRAVASPTAFGPITFDWTVDDEPAGATTSIIPTATTDISATVTFSADTPGVYEITVTGDDGLHTPTSLPFRLHLFNCP